LADYYSILGLPHGAPKAEIKRAYRRLAFQWHPDKNPSPEAKQKFILITEAYDALMDGRTFRQRTFTPSKEATPKPKSEEEIRREKMLRYYEMRQGQFRELRRKLRNDASARRKRYGYAYFLLASCALLLIIPLLIAMLTGNFGALIVCIGLSARLGMLGYRYKERADMIFGEEEEYSFNELNTFFMEEEKKRGRY
jgi:hypothetical protein